MIVLDTHIWVELVNGDLSRWSPIQRKAIHQAPVWVICPISCWEVAMLVQRGRLQLSQSATAWVQAALAKPRFRVESITPDIAVNAGDVPSALLHGDPADRLIVMTARSLNCPLMTRDNKIIDANLIPTIA